MIEDKNIALKNYGELQAGDATFHYGWALRGRPATPRPTCAR